MSRIENNKVNAPPEAECQNLLAERRHAYINRGRRLLLLLMLNLKKTATADDVRRRLSLPAEIDPRCLGAIPKPLVKAGIIRLGGYRKSDRPERHASPVSVWQLVDWKAAFWWLEEHPDLPDRLEDD